MRPTWRELGRGGMATVYLAEHLKHHRRVGPSLSAWRRARLARLWASADPELRPQVARAQWCASSGVLSP
jgi:hypothetical protein